MDMNDPKNDPVQVMSKLLFSREELLKTIRKVLDQVEAEDPPILCLDLPDLAKQLTQLQCNIVNLELFFPHKFGRKTHGTTDGAN